MLLDLLNTSESDFEQQWFIVKLLGTFQHPDAILALGKVLETSTDEDVCDQAAQSLAVMGDMGLGALALLLEDPQRLPMAVKALVQIHQPEVVPLLLSAFADASADLRVLILNALDRFQGAEIVSVLRQGLADPSALVCQAAIAGIAAQNEPTPEERVQIIAPFLEDPRLRVAEQTAHSLGRLATDSAVIVLVQKCCNLVTSPILQQTLIRALGWVGSHRALDGLVKLWDQLSLNSPTPEKLLNEILTSVALMTAPEVKPNAAQKLLEFVRSPILQTFPRLKSTAILALGPIADLSMVPALIDLLAISDYGIRLHVIAALKQISAETAHAEIQARSRLANLDDALADGLAIALAEW